MEIKHILEALLRRKALFLYILLSFLLVGTLFSFLLRDSYTASSKVLIAKSYSGEDVLFSVSGAASVDKKADMERQIELVKSGAVMNEVVKELDLRNSKGRLLSIEDITGHIKITPVWEADIIEITAFSDKQGEAAALANSMARQYMKLVQRVKKEESENTVKYLSGEMGKIKVRQQALEKGLSAFKKAHSKAEISEDLRKNADKDVETLVEKAKIESEIKRITMGGLFGSDEEKVAQLNGRLIVLNRAVSKHEEYLSRLGVIERKLYGYARDRRVFNTMYPMFFHKLNEIRVSDALNTSPVQIVSYAGSERRPVRSKGPANFLAVIMISVFAGFIAVFIADYIDQSIKNPEDVRSELGMKLLGQTPPVNLADFSRRNEIVIGKTNEYEPVFVLLKELSADIKGSFDAEERITVAFASPGSDDGKSFVAAAFASYLASAGKKVLLIDADIKGHLQNRIYSHPIVEGFAESLAGEKSALNFVRKTSDPFIEVLFAGDPALYENSIVSFDPARIKGIFAELSPIYSALIVDLPSVDGRSGAVEIASSCDCTVMVIPAGQLDKKSVMDTVSLLKTGGTKFLGSILSNIRTGD
ncbi:MAG: Wzz/FepE/Etk N-terminal domain-containing protein [Candidatus Margulisiibacteriota bacterium]